MVNLRLDRLGSRRTVYVQTTPARSEVHLKKKGIWWYFFGTSSSSSLSSLQGSRRSECGICRYNCDDANERPFKINKCEWSHMTAHGYATPTAHARLRVSSLTRLRLGLTYITPLFPSAPSFIAYIYFYVLALLRLTCTLPLALILAPVHTPQINLLPPPRLQLLQRTISAVIRKSRIGRSHTHHTLSPTPVPPQPHIL